jgi:hypothetical protein
MLKEDFIKLSLGQKTEVLWNQGELISEKAYYDYNITLFLLETFYVEIFFNRVEREIVSISLQDNTQILFGYVKDLKLDELVGAQD